MYPEVTDPAKWFEFKYLCLFATWLSTHPMASTVSANGGDMRFRPNATGNTNTSKIVISEKGKEMDKRLDKHETFVIKICFFNIF
jgi:hypothetical protein